MHRTSQPLSIVRRASLYFLPNDATSLGSIKHFYILIHATTYFDTYDMIIHYPMNDIPISPPIPNKSNARLLVFYFYFNQIVERLKIIISPRCRYTKRKRY